MEFPFSFVMPGVAKGRARAFTASALGLSANDVDVSLPGHGGRDWVAARALPFSFFALQGGEGRREAGQLNIGAFPTSP